MRLIPAVCPRIWQCCSLEIEEAAAIEALTLGTPKAQLMMTTASPASATLD